MNQIDVIRIERAVKLFKEKENGFETRYNSWVYCHEYFVNLYNNNKGQKFENLNKVNQELSLLNLAFYLASWGMYRGSSFILQYDYTIFKNIISMILNEKYDILWNLDYETIKNNQEKVIDLLKKIGDEISDELTKYRNYSNAKSKIGKTNDTVSVSQTLTTKILLGTFCCCPAYDTYFKKSIGKNCSNFYTKNQIKNLLDKITANQAYAKLTNENAGKYPLMKIVDMTYFTIGMEDEFETLYKQYINSEEKVTNDILNKIVKYLKFFYYKIKDTDQYDLHVSFECNKDKVDEFISNNNIKVRSNIWVVLNLAISLILTDVTYW